MLEDIDPNSEWVVEIQSTDFESDFDIEVEDESRWDALDVYPLVPTPRDSSADPDIAGRVVLVLVALNDLAVQPVLLLGL